MKKKTFMNLNLISIRAIIFLFAAFPLSSSAWNWVGHELAAQVAYDQLTPEAKKYWNNVIGNLDSSYPKENFITASILPDQLKERGITAFNAWHYINWPVFQHFGYTKKKTWIRTLPRNPENLSWAIHQSLAVLKNPKAKAFEKAFFAAFLIHLAADAHQPLHCADLYSSRFSRGDEGGNLWKIRSPIANNLHTYWDRGGGFLVSNLIRKNQLGISAQVLERAYPKSYFGSKVQIVDPWIWIKESHQLAKEYVYRIRLNAVPSKSYQQKTRMLTREQIVLSGYRLGFLLNYLAANAR